MKVRTDGVALDRLLRHLGGLTEIDARRLIRNAIYDDGPITEKDLPQVTRLKYQLRDQGGALSFELDTGAACRGKWSGYAKARARSSQ